MIAATNDSINLLTWEPCCDILTTVPLKNVEKVGIVTWQHFWLTEKCEQKVLSVCALVLKIL